MERLLQRCLDYDPHERPSAKEVVEILTCAQLAHMKCLCIRPQQASFCRE